MWVVCSQLQPKVLELRLGLCPQEQFPQLQRQGFPEEGEMFCIEWLPWVCSYIPCMFSLYRLPGCCLLMKLLLLPLLMCCCLLVHWVSHPLGPRGE